MITNDQDNVLDKALKSILKPVNSYLSFFNFRAHHKKEVRELVRSLDRNNPGEAIVKLIEGLNRIQTANVSRLKRIKNSLFSILSLEIYLGVHQNHKNILPLLDLIEENNFILQNVSFQTVYWIVRDYSAEVLTKMITILKRTSEQLRYNLFLRAAFPVNDGLLNTMFDGSYSVEPLSIKKITESLPILLDLLKTLPLEKRRVILNKLNYNRPDRLPDDILKMIKDAGHSDSEVNTLSIPEESYDNNTGSNVQLNIQLADPKSAELFIQKLKEVFQEFGINASDIQINGKNPVVDAAAASSSSSIMPSTPPSKGGMFRQQESQLGLEVDGEEVTVPIQDFFSKQP